MGDRRLRRFRLGPGLVRGELSEFSEVLSRGGEKELVARPRMALVAKAIEPQDAFEMREEHFDFLALTINRGRKVYH